MTMQLTMPNAVSSVSPSDKSIGRIVSVTGSKAIVMLDGPKEGSRAQPIDRPDMGTLLAIDTANTVVLAIVSALSVPVPASATGTRKSGSPSLCSPASCGATRPAAGPSLPAA